MGDHLACPLCPKTFANGERLLSHARRRHAGIALQWTCTVCAKQYDDCRKWMRHDCAPTTAEEKGERVDDAPNPTPAGSVFSCTDCDRSFDSAERLDRHRERRHLPDPSGKSSAVEFQGVKCDDCGKCYLNDERLQRHRGRRHDAGVSQSVVDERTASADCDKRRASAKQLGNRHTEPGSDQSPPKELEPVESVHVKEESSIDARISTTHCHYCDKDFTDSERLERHRRRKHRLRRDSPVRVAEPISMPTPSIIKLSDDGVVCSVCARSFVDEERLERHLARRHADDKLGGEKLAVPVAPSTTTECIGSDPAEVAVMRNLAADLLSCDHCERSFAGVERLERHRARRHADDKAQLSGKKAVPAAQSTTTVRTGSDSAEVGVMHNSDLLPCHHCERSFAGAERLERHRKRKHVDGNLSHQPDVQTLTRSKATVKRSRPGQFQEIVFGLPESADLGQDFLHKLNARRILPRPKIHACKQCGKRYKSARERNVHHRRRHSGLPVFRCGICNWLCDMEINMEGHMAAHRGERSFKCNVCNVAFTMKGNLTVHMRSHSDERPYKCEVCDKAFRSATGLAQHRVVHSSERPFECTRCGSRFKLSTHLRRHEKKSSICLRADALPRRNLEVMVAPA